MTWWPMDWCGGDADEMDNDEQCLERRALGDFLNDAVGNVSMTAEKWRCYQNEVSRSLSHSNEIVIRSKSHWPNGLLYNRLASTAAMINPIANNNKNATKNHLWPIQCKDFYSFFLVCQITETVACSYNEIGQFGRRLYAMRCDKYYCCVTSPADASIRIHSLPLLSQFFSLLFISNERRRIKAKTKNEPSRMETCKE